MNDSGRCRVMGIVNRTPDSFYDGGRMALDELVEHALRLVAEGADIVEVGGIKAGPGDEVSEREEIDRVLPAVDAIARSTNVVVSVDTARAKVAELAIAAGATIVNDVSGLSDPDLASVCGRFGASLVVMHNGGQIRGRPRHPRYDDVVGEVVAELDRLATIAQERGVPRRSVIVDPGLDFGKTTFHSLELMRHLDRLVAEGRPVLVAPSRKDVVGETLGLTADERLEGTLALVALAVLNGAAIVRVHDVAAAVRTVHMVEAVMGVRRPRNPVRGLWD